jgi:two-component system probable response regulator PhcQ
MKRILLIDDEEYVLSAIKRLLRASFGSSISIEVFSRPQLALARLKEAHFDLVMSDYRMPEMSGMDVLRSVRALQPSAVRMILSATSDFAIIQQAVNEVEVFRFLAKPWRDAELVQHIRCALAKADELRAEKQLADAMRVQQGDLSASDVELRRLEELEPGITHVEWGPHGEVLMPGELIEPIVPIKPSGKC